MESPRKKSPRFSACQITVFSTGNLLFGLQGAVFSSYWLTFQTKVLGLPSNIVGLLWLLPLIIDAFLALVNGHMSDKVRIPFLSRVYGRRKTWHLIGGTLASIGFPFLLMECFPCSGMIDDWRVVVYYVILTVVCYSGMGLTQSNFLALIPEVTSRQSDMVKLGAVSSVMSLLSGIYVYAVMWVLLGSDVNATLSQRHKPEFLKLVLITQATALFSEMLFHVCVREPSAKGLCRRRKQGPSDDETQIEPNMGKKEKRSKSLPLVNGTPKETTTEERPTTNSDPSHVNLSYENEEEKHESTVSSDSRDEVTGQSHSDNAKALREMLQKTLPEENMSRQNQDSDTDSLSSIGSFDGQTSEGWTSGHETTDVDSDNFELFMPKTFVDMVPFHSNVILSSRRNSKATGIGQFIASSRGPSRTASQKSRHSVAMNRRVSNDYENQAAHDSRRGSRITTHGLHSDVYRRSSNMYQQSPLASIEDNPTVHHHPGILSISRQNSRKRWENSHINQFPSRNISLKKSPLAAPGDQSPSCPRAWDAQRNASIKKSPLAMEEAPVQDAHNEGKVSNKVRLSLTPEHIIDHFIINAMDEDLDSYVEEKKNWISVLKSPSHFKLGFAYLFTRLAQNVTSAYMPLFLTDHLKYEKMAIAYFPIVILVSGVIASFGGKKLNTILGNKWTFCLGSIMVMGASGWFYLLTLENRSVTYVPAILSGCGTSIMFVTTLALAAEFVDEDRDSGAFLMAAMGFLSKIVTGVLFCLLQEFSPEITDPHYVHYTHYVFSLTPGVSAFCGLLAFIVFIPATIQCKPIIETEDAETQTDETSFASTTSILDIIEEDVGTDEDPGQGNSYLNIIEEGDEAKGSEILKHEIMENIKEEEAYTEEESEAMERESMGKGILENVQNEEGESEEIDTAM